MKRLCLVLLMGLCFAPAWAAAPQPFTKDSLAAIQARYAGRPFILSLWSANNCEHCIAELKLFGKLNQQHGQLPLVLVAVDGPAFAASIVEMQQSLGLSRMESWVFQDEIPERLRASIDPRWQGEIPRTYLYDAQHRRTAIAGVISEARLQAWLAQQNLNQANRE